MYMYYSTSLANPKAISLSIRHHVMHYVIAI